MNKFKTQLKLIEEALLKPMSDERVKEVDKIAIDEWVRNFLKRDDIKKNSDGSYDVDGSVYFDGNSSNGQLPISFNIVNGIFDCYNMGLTTLKGSPNIVFESFDCHGNRLTNLKYGPKRVDFCYHCYKNQLTTLEGAPREIGRDFYADYNRLTDLKGSPRKIGDSFLVHGNNLTSLEGAPDYVAMTFDVSQNTKKFSKDEVKAACKYIGYKIRTKSELNLSENDE